MKVKELIEKLQAIPDQDANVYFEEADDDALSLLVKVVEYPETAYWPKDINEEKKWYRHLDDRSMVECDENVVILTNHNLY